MEHVASVSVVVREFERGMCVSCAAAATGRDAIATSIATCTIDGDARTHVEGGGDACTHAHIINTMVYDFSLQLSDCIRA